MKSSVSLSAHQKLCVAVAALALGSTAVWESTTTAAGASTASAMDSSPSTSTARSWSFEDEPTGRTPRGFTVAAGRWELVPDHTGSGGGTALGQFESSPNAVFNVALIEDASYRNVDISVRLRAVAGEVDQGGGIVWRAQDARNSYIARYNPLEDSLRVYSVKDGRRRTIAGASLRVDHEAWHTLRVKMVGDHIECLLDGEKHLDARDTTFTAAGRIGLWTKADAVTHFDNLEVGVPGRSLDAEAIGAAAGTTASTTEDGIVRVTWARSDVPVRVDGMSFPVAAGLTSWAAFAPTATESMVMGDTVVFQDEVSAAMDAAFAHGLDITALHNHFFYDEPRVYFMHIGGHGDALELAHGVKAIWGAIRGVRRKLDKPANSFPGAVPASGVIDEAMISRITGEKAAVKGGGVVKVSIGREAAMHGASFSGSMGLTTWAAFTGSDELATIDGDFGMTAGEVQPVLRALRRAGIHVVALHNHMVGEEPAYYFTHFWGKGPAAELARGFRSALDAQR